MKFHDCNHPDHIRYGPCKPSISEKQLSDARRLMHQAEHKKTFHETMETFNDPLVSPRKKAALFKANLLVPSSLVFEQYGPVVFRHGIGMVISFKPNRTPPFVFDFKNDFIVILKNTAEKNYEEVERFPIRAIQLSIRTERDEAEEGEFTEEHLSMHATHNMNFYPNAALESSAL